MDKKVSWLDVISNPNNFIGKDGMKVDTNVEVSFKDEVYVFLFLALLLGIGLPVLGYYFLTKNS